MTADGIVPSLLVALVSLLGGLLARSFARQLSEMAAALERFRQRYEDDMREVAEKTARSDVQIKNLGSRLGSLERGTAN